MNATVKLHSLSYFSVPITYPHIPAIISAVNARKPTATSPKQNIDALIPITAWKALLAAPCNRSVWLAHVIAFIDRQTGARYRAPVILFSFRQWIMRSARPASWCQQNRKAARDLLRIHTLSSRRQQASFLYCCKQVRPLSSCPRLP